MSSNQATFTKKVRQQTYPYLVVSIPADVTRLLGLKSGDYLEVTIKKVG
jgi:bifunctional DNA-binding transcriptional regulator/antitoxin component of YhaV-PrlF toxin-antitoxin module